MKLIIVDRQTLIKLLEKHALGMLNESELEQLRDSVNSEGGEKLLSEVWDENFKALPLDEEKSSKESLFRRVTNDERIIAASPNSEGRTILKWSFQIAAAMILLVGLGSLYLLYNSPSADHQLTTQDSEILPGSDRARIVFDDGTFIELAAIDGDTLLVDKGIIVFRDQNGVVGYKSIDNENVRENFYTSIITPEGGEYMLLLPDGSRVWLNAASTLRYPLMFDPESRDLSLEGEAYFEVQPLINERKTIPFRVHAAGQILEVLGTSFNIKSYGSEVTTTLVEGSVVLHFPHSPLATELEPGQQATYSRKTEDCVVNNVDPYFATAWRHGSFAFDNASIYAVMEDIARWYDIEVEYVGELSEIRYSGTISRFESFNQLLKIIEWTDLVKFKVEGRRVRVMR